MVNLIFIETLSIFDVQYNRNSKHQHILHIFIEIIKLFLYFGENRPTVQIIAGNHIQSIEQHKEENKNYIHESINNEMFNTHPILFI